MLKTLSTLIVILALTAAAAPAFADADTQTGETHDCIFKRILADHPELFAGGVKQTLLSRSNPIFTFPGINNRGQH